MWVLIIMMMTSNVVAIGPGHARIIMDAFANSTLYKTEQECQRAAQVINRTTWKTELIAYCNPNTN